MTAHASTLREGQPPDRSRPVRQIPPLVAPKIARLNINDVASGFKFENHRKTSKNTASALTAGAQIRCAKRAMGQNKWVEYFLGLEKIFVPKFFRV